MSEQRMSKDQPSLVQWAFTRAALTLNHILNYDWDTGRNRDPAAPTVYLVAATKEKRGLSEIEQLELDWDKLVLGHST